MAPKAGPLWRRRPPPHRSSGKAELSAPIPPEACESKQPARRPLVLPAAPVWPAQTAEAGQAWRGCWRAVDRGEGKCEG